MKSISIIKKITIATILGLFAAAILAVVNMQAHAAVQYDGDNTPPLPSPQFNGYTGVPSYGNEADFLQGKVSTQPNTAYATSVSDPCAVGTKYTLRVYVHNGASQYQNGNGNGPSVAKNTTVKVSIPSGEATSFRQVGTISASNAPTVTDDMTITCTGGKKVKLSYITGSAQQWTQPGGVQSLSDSIVTTGAKVGTVTPNGDVWGCWDQRVYVVLEVEVKEAPVPPPVVSTGVCKAPAVIVNNNERRATVTVNSSVTNATVIGYEIDWGDGNKSATRTATHQYAADGTYNIVTRVQIRLADGTTKWVSGNECNATITIKKPAEKAPYCESLTINKVSGRRVSVLANINANGTDVKTVRYTFGDGSAPVTTNAGRAIEHEYAQDGSFTIAATHLTYVVDGVTKTVEIDCTGLVSFETPPVPPVTPDELPKTGAGDVIVSVLGISLVAAIAHRLFLSRRLTR